jgi:hypothetical protein
MDHIKTLKALGFDLTDAPAPLIDEAGHAAGEKAMAFLDFLAKKLGVGGIGDLPDPIKKNAIPLLIKLLGGATTVNRKAIPLQGTLGDAVHKWANTFLDSTSRGLADGFKQAKKDEDGKKDAAGKADKAAPGDDQLEEMGFVTEAGIWCPAKRCRHFKRPFTQRGQKGPEDISLREALQGDYGICRQGCYGPADIQRFTAIRAGGSPAPSEPKHEEKKTMSDAPAKPATPPAKTFGQLMAEFRKADRDAADNFYAAFEILARRDPALGEKVRQVFSSVGTLDDLQALSAAPPERWHLMLDDLRGGSNPVQDGIIRTLAKVSARFGGAAAEAASGFVSTEAKQSDEMLVNVGEACDGVTADYERRNAELARPKKPAPDATVTRKGIPLPALISMSCAALVAIVIVLRHL